MGEAIGYLRRQRKALVRYLEDGDLAIDNNASERALRMVRGGYFAHPAKERGECAGNRQLEVLEISDDFRRPPLRRPSSEHCLHDLGSRRSVLGGHRCAR
jgi:hypothetical protein